jgi:hypothetical protein
MVKVEDALATPTEVSSLKIYGWILQTESVYRNVSNFGFLESLQANVFVGSGHLVNKSGYEEDRKLFEAFMLGEGSHRFLLNRQYFRFGRFYRCWPRLSSNGYYKRS